MGQLLGTFISRLRAERDLTLQGLADIVGVSYPAISQWEHGKTTPSRANAQKLAVALGIMPDEMDRIMSTDLADKAKLTIAAEIKADRVLNEGHDLRNFTHEPIRPKKIRVPAPGAVKPRQLVPVLGVAIGGSADSGDFFVSEDPIDYVGRPPGLEYAKSPYAIYVSKDSMWPKFEPGELLYVDPSRSAVVNDYVVIQLYGATREDPCVGLVKRLAARTPTKIRVRQFNPDMEFEWGHDEVAAVHRILTWRELINPLT